MVGALTRTEAAGRLGTEKGAGREGAAPAGLFALREGISPASAAAHNDREVPWPYL